ncbi:hypothetical protein KI387_043489, partial [Taxus chinensis]
KDDPKSGDVPRKEELVSPPEGMPLEAHVGEILAKNEVYSIFNQGNEVPLDDPLEQEDLEILMEAFNYASSQDLNSLLME